MADAVVINRDAPSAPAARNPDRPKVLYIGGQGRSGSTILGRLLGELDGFVHVGELGLIWSQVQERRLCGCGIAFTQCPFWGEVLEEAYGGLKQAHFHEIRRVKRDLESHRAIPKLIGLRHWVGRTERFRRYIASLNALYAAIAKVSGARVLIDGSKAPLFNYVLDSASIDLYSLHLVRDSRAVAHSNRRQKSELLADGGSLSLGKLSHWRTAVEWNVHNTLMQMRRRAGDRYLRIRYEDMALDPRSILAEIGRFVGEPEQEMGFLAADPISLSTQHNICGNPDRFRQTVTISTDSEWIDGMDPRQRRLVTALTWPLLTYYGYARHPAATQDGSEAR